jgi:hypothetical protein
MIVRIRSSVGTWRIDISDNASLGDLKAAISLEYGIPIQAIILANDLQIKESFIGNDIKLSQFGIKHGSLLYLDGRHEKKVIEKSYIDDDGKIVEAGVKIVVKEDSTQSPNTNGGIVLKDSMPSVSSNTNSNSKVESVKPVPTHSGAASITANSTNGTTDNVPPPTSNPANNTVGDQISTSALSPEELEALSLAAIEDLTRLDGDHDDALRSPEVRQPDTTKKMCLYDYEDEDEDEGVDMHGYGAYGGSDDIFQGRAAVDDIDIDPEIRAAALAAGVKPWELKQMAQAAKLNEARKK